MLSNSPIVRKTLKKEKVLHVPSCCVIFFRINIKLKMSSQMSATELLKLGDQGRIKPFLNVYWPQIIGVSLGVATAAFLNYQSRKPVYSGIQKYAIAAGGWTAALTYVQTKRDEYLAEKDAVYRHYIELHPEDFVVPERRKIGDILEPWIPVR